jgi:hypothetical protein
MRAKVPCFSFHVSQGKFSNAAIATVYENGGAARQEALAMFGDLSRDICRGMNCNSQWQMELTDATGRPIFRLRLSMESLVEEDQATGPR